MIFFPSFFQFRSCMCVPNSNSFFFWVGGGEEINFISLLSSVFYTLPQSFCLGALGCFCDLLLALIFFHHFLSLPRKTPLPTPPQSLLLHTSIITKRLTTANTLHRLVWLCVYVCECVHGAFGTSFSSLLVTSIFIIVWLDDWPWVKPAPPMLVPW